MINRQFLVGISRFTLVVVSLTMLAGTQALADAASVFVKTTTVQRGVLTESLRAYGSVVASPAAVRNLSATRAGEIGAVEVLAGAEVIKGQALLEFRNDPAVTAAHSQAASAVGLARADLQRTEGLFALKLATESQLAAAKKALADARGNLAEIGRAHV